MNEYGSNIHMMRNPESTYNLADALVGPIFLLALLTKCIFFQFNTGVSDAPVFSEANTGMLIMSTTSILFIFSLVLLIFNTKRLTAVFVTDLILSILVFADTLYFRYYNTAITLPVFRQIGLVSTIADSTISLLRPGDLIFAVDFPIFIIYFLLIRKKRLNKPAPIKLFIRVISTVLILCICIGVSHYACRIAPADTTDTEFTISSGNNKVITDYGLFYFHYYDIKGSIIELFFTDRTLEPEEKQELDEFFVQKDSVSKNNSSIKYKGIAEGKNLIVIQMEAIQQFLINAEYNGREITPNLNKFIDDSIYLDNFFYQVGAGNTSDAEFLTNNSLYPLKEGAVYFKYPYNTYESLPNILNSRGYSTYVFHANKPSYWNRNEMYKSVGFRNFISSNKFDQDDIIGWGLSDKSMFRQAVDKIDTSNPFYGFFITLSSHHPYNYFTDFDNFDVTGCNNEMAANYMKAANYVDQAIGEFFDMLKQKGLYDNSVIVIYGDHHAVMKDQTDVLTELTGFQFTEYNWTMQQKTPCFIHFPGMDKTGVNNTVCGEIDILPTIANLMGFEVPHALGKDILNTDNGYAVLRDSSVITDEFAYIASEEKVYDNNGSPLSLKSYEDVIAGYQHELDISEIILKKNALKSYKQ